MMTTQLPVNEEQSYESQLNEALGINQQDGEVAAETEEKMPVEAVGDNVDKAPVTKADSTEEKNLVELRLARDRVARERDEALRRLQEYEARNSNRQASADEEEDELSIDADSLVEGKHLKTVNKKIKQLEKSLAQATTTAIENSLRAKFSDFDAVVSQENVTLLRDLYPEVANVIAASPDLYSKSVAAYNFIKSQGLGAQKNFDRDREQAQRNAAKPRPLVSTKGTSPLAHVNEFANGPLTEEYKKQLYKEMVEAASRA
jgi:hypothetical protein